MRRLLVLNFFPAFVPPSSGGELRYFNLYSKLSQEFDVTLLSPTYSDHRHELVEHSESFREVRVPKGTIHNLLHQRLDLERIGPEVSALVCSLSAKSFNPYHQAYLKLYRQADIIVHEFPYMLEYDLFWGIDKKPRIYNSHNVECFLTEQLWEGRNSKKYKAHIRGLEERLLNECDLCFAVSEEERKIFIETFDVCPDKIAVAPNGINPHEFEPREARDPDDQPFSALFFGSYHPPNIAAVDFILNALADRCPEITFLVAGDCGKDFEAKGKQNVKLLGRVDEQTKMQLLGTADVAINPMFSGAGTNLKVLEYLSSGLPLVSTELGARGLNLINKDHFVAADKESFSEKLIDLMLHPEVQERIARSGKEFVDSHYSWDSIVRKVAKTIKASLPLKKEVSKKTLFVLNDFPVDSPSSGGEVRINRIYSGLSRYYRIVLLCLNKHGLITRHGITDSFVQLSLPKTQEHAAREVEMNSKFPTSANDIIASLWITKNELLSTVTRLIFEACDAVILCHPYMVGLLNGLDAKQVIYESLNCEYELKKEILHGHPDYAMLIRAVKECESEAVSRSRFIVSVSDNDHHQLQSLSPEAKPIYTIPNGVDIKTNSPDYHLGEIKKKFRGHPVIAFIGSAHKPNIDSVAYIRDVLAPSLPGCFFLIIGGACDSFRGSSCPNLLLCGKVGETSKEILLKLADLAVNPMDTGSGSNLKLAEYMASKIPTITTSFGARGYSIENGKEAIICELADFKKEITALLDDAELGSSLGERGYRYVKSELDWKVLANRFDRLLKKEIFQPEQKSILVVTYRFTDPPLGGAEVHLLELLRGLDESGELRIDVATLDLFDIANKYHFSSRYTRDENADLPADLHNTCVFRFKTDCLPDEALLRNSRELFDRWMMELRDSSIRFRQHYRHPILMGGWNFPEYVDGACERWTSDEALIFVEGLQSITLKGYSPKRTKLTCFGDSRILLKQALQGSFCLHIGLNQSSVLRLKIDTLVSATDDPRALGIRVTSVEYERSGSTYELRLDHDYRSYLKTHFLDDYVSELIRTAESRPAKYDEIFQATRGPLSRELEEWLDKHTKEYDLVIGHSIPFATSVLAAKYAKRFAKPLLLIPDFHLDDEFYHWRSYYDALRQADTLLTFPKAASKLFFDKIGCRSNYLPPGIHLNEEPTELDRNAFEKLYRSELPYVLVLGRKARAKQYQTVIESVKKINVAGRLCNVVIIGRDEDGLVIDPDDALYFGGQPRNVVLSALRNAVCLVAMSESESFGIVLLEAWAQRRPVIVADRCIAYSELVTEGVDGLTANKENLHHKILYLLNNTKRAGEMGLRGYERVRKEFAWETIARDFRSLVQHTIDLQKDRTTLNPRTGST